MYYAVVIGKKPGIYSDWDECKEQIDDFKGCKYKRFETSEEAEKYLVAGLPWFLKKREIELPQENRVLGVWTDGSVIGKRMSYAYIVGHFSSIEDAYKCGDCNGDTIFHTHSETHSMIPYISDHVELMAIYMSLAYVYSNIDDKFRHIKHIEVYSDSKKAIMYINNFNEQLYRGKYYKDILINCSAIIRELERKCSINIQHVLGHSTNMYNRIADKLCGFIVHKKKKKGPSNRSLRRRYLRTLRVEEENKNILYEDDSYFSLFDN